MTDARPSPNGTLADLILANGRIATQDDRQSFVNALAIKDGRVHATGDAAAVMAYRGAATRVVELNGRTVIPGLIDSHSHPIRGGLSYNLELRWDGVPSLADAMRMLREQAGNPTGLLLARPNAFILYATLAKGPKLPYEQQLNSTRQFMRELNRLGVTSVIDAGGGFQNYPQDYQVVTELHRSEQLTVRLAANLFTQRPKEELADFSNWVKAVKPGQGDDLYRINGAGEMLVYSAADFEDFLEPRPDMPAGMEADLSAVVGLLAANRWPFRLHATYDETIARALNVYEAVDREVPFDGLHWIIDHAETISPRNIDRIRTLGGGIAVQHRMAYQGETFINRYGKAKAEHSPPIKRMLAAGVPVGAGTDATRGASYNPFVSLYWLIAGKTVGGMQMYTGANRLERMEALRLWTVGSSWFSSEDGKKGALAPGQLADCAVLSADYFSIPEEEIKGLESVLTLVGGKPVYGAAEFQDLSPPPLPVSPEWSPVAAYGGYGAPLMKKSGMQPRAAKAPRCSTFDPRGLALGFGRCACAF